jgi:hypothetical protein
MDISQQANKPPVSMATKQYDRIFLTKLTIKKNSDKLYRENRASGNDSHFA